MNTSSVPVSPLSNLRVVLVETSHPGNLGAAARAMKVMGLTDLRLVNPVCAIDDEALARASGAADVLEAARIVDSLDAALADTALAAACTSRRRDLPHPAYTPRQAAPEMLALAQQAPVALVFGSETYGLSNAQIMKKYKLSERGLNSLLTKLHKRGLISAQTFTARQQADSQR